MQKWLLENNITKFQIYNEKTNQYIEYTKTKPCFQSEIIKCKNCKWCSSSYIFEKDAPFYRCSYWKNLTDLEGFCYKGIKKEKE